MDNTFEMAKMNMRINGKNFEDLDADEQGKAQFHVFKIYLGSQYIVIIAGSEPFDEGFDRHIWALSDQSLNLDGEIAKYRREEPDRLLKVMQEILDKQRVVDEKEAELLVPDDNVEDEQDEGTYSTRYRHILFSQMSFFYLDNTELYENAETVMRKVYAMTEELQQVRVITRIYIFNVYERFTEYCFPT